MLTEVMAFKADDDGVRTSDIRVTTYNLRSDLNGLVHCALLTAGA